LGGAAAVPWRLGGAVGDHAAKPVSRRIWNGNLARLKAQIEHG
jgi:hypothetical protein